VAAVLRRLPLGQRLRRQLELEWFTQFAWSWNVTTGDVAAIRMDDGWLATPGSPRFGCRVAVEPRYQGVAQVDVAILLGGRGVKFLFQPSYSENIFLPYLAGSLASA
jgi:hypothetical protein